MSQVSEPAPRYTTIDGWTIELPPDARKILNFDLPGDHLGLPIYLSILASEIAAFAIIVLLTRRVVAHTPNSQIVATVWSRIPEIRCQPITNTLLYAVLINLGLHEVIFRLLGAFTYIVGLDASSFLPATFAAVLTWGLSPFIAMLVYRLGGGRYWKTYALVAPSVAYASRTQGAINIIELIVAVVLDMPFNLWGAYKQLRTTAKPIDAGPAVTKPSKLGTSVLLVAGPLALIKALSTYLSDFVAARIYLYRVTKALAWVELLSACALASAFTLERTLLAGEVRWQWRAFLAPVIPLAITHLGVYFTAAYMFGWPSFVNEFIHTSISLCGYGAAGLMGGAAYLKLVERRHLPDAAEKQIIT